MNDLMSAGMHRRGRTCSCAACARGAASTILDMAGGTGDIAFRMARRGAQVTVADINPTCWRRHRAGASSAGSRAGLGAENAEELSFADRSFDAYTIAFGIRNVTHIEQALARRTAC
jgi:demethylmenaquinone methyltransferase/2-methoxy-6-polyprenyl-1,4-benzoquinol methylase